MTIRKTLTDELQSYFADKPVARAYLFGSHARAEAAADSDIDILVELDYSRPIGLEFIKMQLDLQDILGQKVDLLTENSVSKHIKPHIDQDKVLVYECKTDNTANPGDEDAGYPQNNVAPSQQ